MTDEGFTKFVNFMTPGVGVLMLRCGHKSDTVKIHYFFKKYILLYSQAQIRHTEGIVLVTKEKSTKIVNFFTTGQGFLC